MNDEEQKLPKWLQEIEPYVRQHCELQLLQDKLANAIRVPSTEETTTRMGVRLSFEREIQGRMDNLERFIALNVVEHFRSIGILSKYPELRTNHNGT